MTALYMQIIRGIIYVAPAYIANSSPVIVGGGPPIDMGKNFIDGRRIFGDHKTIRGLIGGILFGTLTGLIIFPFISRVDFQCSIGEAILWALLLSIGTHIGDLLGSFIKRRLNMKPGSPAPILDQIGFIIFALLLAWPRYPWITSTEITIVIILTLIIHPLSNVAAYLAGLKDKPW